MIKTKARKAPLGILISFLFLGAVSTVAGTPVPAAGTSAAADALFAQPYIDKDEWRDAPVRHRYVHGGFKGTETKFSFYFPPKTQYRGHFYQHVTPVPDSENNAQGEPPGEANKIGFAAASGAYFVETNGGGRNQVGAPGTNVDPSIGAYRANAAAAQYSRVIALQMYGGKRPYGYVFGGSGGAYRTLGSVENTTGIWDGAVPFVLGSTMAIPNMFTVRMHAMRILNEKFPQIIDAVEPGGNGDPYAGLNEEQAAALREVTRMGFPMPSWFGYKTMGIHGFAALYQGMVMADPTYFTDFWTKPGYLGFDHPESFANARMQFKTVVSAPITAAEAAQLGLDTSVVNGQKNGGVDTAYGSLQGDAAKQVVAVRLAAAPPTIQFLGGDLIVSSGAAQGQSLTVSRIAGDTVILGIVDPAIAAKIAAGDAVQVDNSNFLAAQTYHRHQVPGPEFTVWDQFRSPDGKPLYPQRPMLLGPLFTATTVGSLPTGKFQGKMILLESLWDREAFPWSADWYRAKVAQNLGDKIDDRFRLWYTDHALHGDESNRQEDPTRTVGYLGVLEQALRDLSAWVEQGIAPPPSTNYRIDDGQVIVPATAAERRGIQPVVSLTANGKLRADVAVGQPVRFSGVITVPPGAGEVIAAEWDFDGAGDFPITSSVAHGSKTATVTMLHSFAHSGTFFPALRGISQRQGDARTPYTRIQNLGRVRVVVN